MNSVSLRLIFPIAVLFLSGTAYTAAAFNAPFTISGIPVVAKKKPKEYDCESVPDPIISIDAPSSYRQDDPTRSTIDEESRKEYLEKVTPLREYNQAIVKMANTYTEGKYDRSAVAECAKDWLLEWADADALSNLNQGTAQLHIGQTLAALSFSVMQFGNDPAFDAESKTKILNWLASIAKTMINFVDSREDRRTSENNIRYWNGLGAVSVAVVTNDQSMFNWGVESARIGIRQIREDGSLPTEMLRAGRARKYHFFAAQPLVATAEIAAANGIDLYSEERGALHRLVKLLINTYDDTSFFEQKTGAKQVTEGGKIQENEIAWLYIYNNRFPSPQAERILSDYPDLAASALGGNVKLLYGH
ncbi:MAG: alginate lyase family protein [Rickettsiales bacterium]